MIRSMTGFATTTLESRNLRVKLTIKTLNHRYFEWIYRGPDYGDLEIELRSLTQGQIKRGRVEVSLEMTPVDPSSWEVEIDEGLLDRLAEVTKSLAEKFGQPLLLSSDIFFRIPQLIEIRQKELDSEDRAILRTALEKTLEKVIKVKEKEGKKMALAIRASVRRIRESLRKIQRLRPRLGSAWRERIQARIKEILVNQTLSPERLEEEVAYLLLRGDCSEEITRMQAHLDSLEEVLRKASAEPKGRMLDFLAQELLREVTTMNSKSQDLEITNEGLVIKAEIEAIRQHVLNIE